MKKLLIIIGVTVGLNTSIVADPIHDAAKNGDINAVQAELDKGVDVNYVDDWYRTTPLYLAVENGHIDIAKLLIAYNANVNATASDNLRGAAGKAKAGTTVVFAAVDNFDMSDLLIRSGADLNIKSKPYLVTVLHTLAASESESENVIRILNLLIDNGVDINAMTAPYSTNIYKYIRGSGTPSDIALANENFEILEVLQKYGGKTTGELIKSLQNKTEKLEKLVNDNLINNTTNPTDEWPRKMWEIDLGFAIGSVYTPLQGGDNAITLETDGNRKFWIRSDGSYSELDDSVSHLSIIYMNNNNLIWITNNSENKKIVSRLSTTQTGVLKRTFISKKLTDTGANRMDVNSPTVQVSWEGSKLTGWDFTPPSSTAPKPDEGNGGGNETANSRIGIKTDGAYIALATDGTLGAAELQKSNDLRSWRKLGDVREEVSEVLVTPGEIGNEFYRLKKK